MKRVRLEYLEERTLLAALPILSISNPAPFPEGSTGTSNMVFVISRSGDTAPALSVHYQTQNGTAVAGVDYVTTSGSVNFAANQTSATVSVPVIGSTVFKADTTFTLAIQPDITIAGNQDFAVSGFPTSATVVDVNGDGLPDIVTANSGANTVSVLLNTSTGTAATAFSLAA
ncbi:Calx-beta domain-containing protein, partial [Singulisphaera rosea]